MIQMPSAFEFNEELLLLLAAEVISPTTGTFLGDSELERSELKVSELTASFWDLILENKH